MSRVFISSVVRNFEEYRDSARRAVELLGLQPVMSESFGARAHSSEVACISEVQGSDVYVLILGRAYGFVPEGDDVSVTHSEYRAARASNRPILVFIQDVDMDDAQRVFRNEVEDYRTGAFRVVFSNPEELKDAIVQALSVWQRSAEALPADAFEARVDDTLEQLSENRRNGYEPRVAFTFLPQPASSIDVAAVERDLDKYFGKLVDGGFATLRDGYESVGHHRWAGLRSGNTLYALFDDGLQVLVMTPARNGCDSLGYFISPEALRHAASRCFDLLPISAGYFSLRMMVMDMAFVAEHPGGNSLQMGGLGRDNDYRATQFFNPFSRTAFEDWLDATMNAIERRYAYPPRF